MSELSIAINPGMQATRVLATEGHETILKARLLAVPKHPRAVQWLLEALALWQGQKALCALYAAGGVGGFANSFYHDWFMPIDEPLYAVRRIEKLLRRRREDKLPAMGDFSDLKQLQLWMQTEGVCIR